MPGAEVSACEHQRLSPVSQRGICAIAQLSSWEGELALLILCQHWGSIAGGGLGKMILKRRTFISTCISPSQCLSLLQWIHCAGSTHCKAHASVLSRLLSHFLPPTPVYFFHFYKSSAFINLSNAGLSWSSPLMLLLSAFDMCGKLHKVSTNNLCYYST